MVSAKETCPVKGDGVQARAGCWRDAGDSLNQREKVLLSFLINEVSSFSLKDYCLIERLI